MKQFWVIYFNDIFQAYHCFLLKCVFSRVENGERDSSLIVDNVLFALYCRLSRNKAVMKSTQCNV